MAAEPGLPAALDRVLAEIDRDELADLARDLVAIPSPTGDERAVGEFVLSWLRKNGLETLRQEVEPDRYNVVGILPGQGKGASLTFNSHFDTPLPADVDHLLLLRGIRPEFDPEAARDAHLVYGRGSVNDKGPLACHLMAVRAIKRSGIPLPGDLFTAGVVGEVGAVPIGPYEGRHYRGKGIGTRFLLTHGVVSDYAVVAEPSAFGITWAGPGSAWLRVTTHGTAVYTPYTVRGERAEESPNAIVRAARVILAIEEWAAAYERHNRYAFSGGEIRPKVSIGAIAGGIIYKPNYAPNACDIFVDVRIPPGIEPLAVKYDLQDHLDGLDCGVRVELILSQKGYEGKNAAGLVELFSAGYRDATGEDPEPVEPIQTSKWNDLNIYNELGMVAIKCGPGHKSSAPTTLFTADNRRIEHQPIDHLVKACRIYAAAALRICTQERPPRQRLR